MEGVPSDVLENFKRFDTDQSGSISRDELTSVMQALQADWTEESTDELLCRIDVSLDGQLQVEEFLQWVFAINKAEDEGADSLPLPDMQEQTLILAGCSRENFNGEYVKESGTLHNGRPVFYCAKNAKYLFYNSKRQQWQVFHDLGKLTSLCLKTQQGPQTAATWNVWDRKKKAFKPEPDVSCTVKEPPSPEELCASAPPIVHQPMGGQNGYGLGLFRKTDEIFNGRPVYVRTELPSQKKTYLFYQEAQVAYNSEKKAYLPNGDKNKMKRWKKSPALSEQAYCFNLSEKTESYSPHEAKWVSGGKVLKWFTPDPADCPERVWKEASAEDLEPVPEGWKDPDFPHDESSLYNPKKHEWLRAFELSKHQTGTFKPTLFGDEGPEPEDAIQTGLCNCWFMAAISTLADKFPDYLESLFLTKEPSLEGKYQIRLFRFWPSDEPWEDKEWLTVTIDDYLPCKPGRSNQPMMTRELLYGRLNMGKMWVPLLEKAFVKYWHKHSYKSFVGSIPEMAWQALTGQKTGYMIYGAPHKPERPKWQLTEDVEVVKDPEDDFVIGSLKCGATVQEVERCFSYLKFEKIDGDGPDEGWMPYYVKGKKVGQVATPYPWHSYDSNGDGKTERSEDWIWAKLLEVAAGNYLVATDPSTTRSECKSNGLHSSHSYAFLDAKEMDGWRLVCLRNPWGRSEWLGPWSDLGDEWQAHPKVDEACKRLSQDDGLFWMEFGDFKYMFGGLRVTPFTPPEG
ncbi:unnamed protein product [Durusdinium trenchii]|uniref:Uncharacterized protein n=2 Tax=Durusdinium trenchii TaxID=1381693 RepID=A0ABP0J2L5_9DINO